MSVSELTASKLDTALKEIEKILAEYDPRLNWKTFSPFGTEKTLMTVPLSDAVAINVPVELKEIMASGALWAWITFVTD